MNDETSQNSDGQEPVVNNSSNKEKKHNLNQIEEKLQAQEKEVRDLIFELRVVGRMKDKEIAKACGWDKSYISHLKSSKRFRQYWPLKEKNRQKILQKLTELRNRIPNNLKDGGKHGAAE